ncbi:recombinase family protein [Brevibacterium ammoniilyticum]|uniref:Recombinase family protein n=1 Tax=Brevibacterium ammoniilyticum TaxID=1046555 RepID=A0ABP9TXN0_9MICO
MSLPDTNLAPFAFDGLPPALAPVETDDEPRANSSAVSSAPTGTIDVPPGSRAVIYLRVSSKGQVNTDYDPEGISIPAQRTSCERKAEALGLTIVHEYIEPGRSATEMTKRVAFQEMLERIRRDRDVDYVIVYKLSRFARNRTDDAIVMADLQKRGVTLISATEQIDATPVGQLMHGILAAFNEYRSREDGADIAYKMKSKAMNGGTLGRAPIGYLNVTENIDGRKINTVQIDPERAPFVKLAFELYASRDKTFADIAEELTDRGLRTRPTQRRPAGPISDSKIQQLLRDRYYLGEVRYKGESYPGRHEALIDEDLFNRVQELMDERGYAAERRKRHDHYLKGTIWCGQCRLEQHVNRRMILMRTTGRHGNADYGYFFCRGVQDHVCDAPYSSIDRVEDAIAEHYKTIRLSPAFVTAVRSHITSALNDQAAAQQLLRKNLEDQLAQLTVKEDNLLDLAADGALPQDRIRQRLRDLARDRQRVTEQLSQVHGDLSSGRAFLDAHLDLLDNPYELYVNASEATRRKLNQAIFAHVYVAHDEVVGDDIRSPLRELLAAERGWEALTSGATPEVARSAIQTATVRHSGPETPKAAPKGGLAELQNLWLDLPGGIYEDADCSKPLMVEVRGFEPLTFSMPWRRATNCAIPPLA